tara:strand:- start:186 stop:902 length:717 start_codon:yes stop_codon:yes gene_type:complete
MKKYIPNLFTSLNLTCGCIAILLLSKDNYDASVILCLLAFFFDFADGYFARLLNSESAIGRELDSFSDFVTSGVVPGIIMYKLLVRSGLIEKQIFIDLLNISFYISTLSLVAFFITIATAFRLSKYNLMKNEFKYFVGLPAPANCMMILGLPFIFDYVGEKYLSFNVLCTLTFFSVYMLNSKIKLISLKNINILIVVTLLFLMCALTFFTNFAVLTVIILVYIIFSISYFQFRRWISF